MLNEIPADGPGVAYTDRRGDALVRQLAIARATLFRADIED